MRSIALLLLCAVVAACGPPYEDLPMTPTQGFARSEDALRRGEYATAVTGFSDYISSGQETFRARAFYELAQAQYGLENYEAALDTLGDLQDEYPKQKWAQPDALRGDVYYAMGRRVDAILAWQSAWERSSESEKQFLRARIEEAVDELTPAESSRVADELTNDELRAMLGPHEATAHAKHAAAAPRPLPAPAAAPAPPSDLDTDLPADDTAGAPAATTGGGSMAANEVRGSAEIGAGELGIASGETSDAGVHVGCLLPLTGPDRAYGQRALSGLRLAFAGDPNTLMVRDSGGQPDVAAQLATALAGDPTVLALVGPLRSNTAAAVAPLAEQLQMPTLLLARDEGLAGPFVLQTGTTQGEQMRVLIDYAINTLQVREFGIVYPDDGYGRSYLTRFRDQANAGGATLVRTNAYRVGQQNFAPQSAAIKAWVNTDALQALFLPDGATTATAVAAAARAVAPQIVLLGTESWNQPDVIAASGSQLDGAVFADSFFAGSPSAVDFATRFRAAYGYDPSGFEAQAYDAGMLVRQAVANGARTRGALLQSLRGLGSFEGAGTMQGGPQGPQHSLVLLEVRGGRVTTVR